MQKYMPPKLMEKLANCHCSCQLWFFFQKNFAKIPILKLKCWDLNSFTDFNAKDAHANLIALV